MRYIIIPSSHSVTEHSSCVREFPPLCICISHWRGQKLGFQVCISVRAQSCDFRLCQSDALTPDSNRKYLEESILQMQILPFLEVAGAASLQWFQPQRPLEFGGFMTSTRANLWWLRTLFVDSSKPNLLVFQEILWPLLNSFLPKLTRLGFHCSKQRIWRNITSKPRKG